MSLKDQLLPNNIKIDNSSSPWQGDIDKMAHDWASKTVQKLKANISKKGIVDTGELLNSLSFTVNSDPPSITFFFSAHGRILEVKQLFWFKPPPYKEIVSWVKRQGVQNFDFIPGYEKQGMRALTSLDQDKAASRIAWGIMKDRASGHFINQTTRWKRKKQWQNPSAKKGAKDNMGTSIGHLKHLLEEELSGLLENNIVKSIQIRNHGDR